MEPETTEQAAGTEPSGIIILPPMFPPDSPVDDDALMEDKEAAFLDGDLEAASVSMEEDLTTVSVNKDSGHRASIVQYDPTLLELPEPKNYVLNACVHAPVYADELPANMMRRRKVDDGKYFVRTPTSRHQWLAAVSQCGVMHVSRARQYTTSLEMDDEQAPRCMDIQISTVGKDSIQRSLRIPMEPSLCALWCVTPSQFMCCFYGDNRLLVTGTYLTNSRDRINEPYAACEIDPKVHIKAIHMSQSRFFLLSDTNHLLIYSLNDKCVIEMSDDIPDVLCAYVHPSNSCYAYVKLSTRCVVVVSPIFSWVLELPQGLRSSNSVEIFNGDSDIKKYIYNYVENAVWANNIGSAVFVALGDTLYSLIVPTRDDHEFTAKVVQVYEDMKAGTVKVGDPCLPVMCNMSSRALYGYPNMNTVNIVATNIVYIASTGHAVIRDMYTQSTHSCDLGGDMPDYMATNEHDDMATFVYDVKGVVELRPWGELNVSFSASPESTLSDACQEKDSPEEGLAKRQRRKPLKPSAREKSADLRNGLLREQARLAEQRRQESMNLLFGREEAGDEMLSDAAEAVPAAAATAAAATSTMSTTTPALTKWSPSSSSSLVPPLPESQ